MRERRREPRQLCSDLISVLQDGSEQTAAAILEDVSPSGACVQLEAPIPVDAKLRLVVSNLDLRGNVRYCRHQKGEGYFVGVEFESGMKWSPNEYRPAHLLDPRKLKGKPTSQP